MKANLIDLSDLSWTYIISAVRIFSYTNLSVLKVSVDILRFVEKIEHLPNGKFKVHLSEVEYPPQVLKSLSMSLSHLITYLLLVTLYRFAAADMQLDL